MSDVRCLSCAHVYPEGLDMCPNRYLSPHGEEFNRRVVAVALALGWQAGTNLSSGVHVKAIELSLLTEPEPPT